MGETTARLGCRVAGPASRAGSPRALFVLCRRSIRAPISPSDAAPRLRRWPDSETMWDAQVEYLSDRGYRCVTLTLPHYGGRGTPREAVRTRLAEQAESRAPREPPWARAPALTGGLVCGCDRQVRWGYDFDELAEICGRTMVASLECAEQEQCVLVIHDWGCHIGHFMQRTHQQYVSKIVAMDVGPPTTRCGGARPHPPNGRWHARSDSSAAPSSECNQMHIGCSSDCVLWGLQAAVAQRPAPDAHHGLHLPVLARHRFRALCHRPDRRPAHWRRHDPVSLCTAPHSASAARSCAQRNGGELTAGRVSRVRLCIKCIGDRHHRRSNPLPSLPSSPLAPPTGVD